MSTPMPAQAGYLPRPALIGPHYLLSGVTGRFVFPLAVGYWGARLLRQRGLSWTWSLAPLAGSVVLAPVVGPMHAPLVVASLSALIFGRRWHRRDLRSGGDLAQVASARLAPVHLLARSVRRCVNRLARPVDAEGMLLGHDERGGIVRIPLAGRAGAAHTLVVGTTGSGKTVTQAAIAVRAIEHGMGAVVVDPKGDAFLREHLRSAAARRGRSFLEWTPDGPSVYNPLARGSETEIADKALSGEEFTEPHYLRQAQRYLGHATRVLRAAGMQISFPVLVAHLDPMRLEVTARRIDEERAEATFAYLDSLTARQQRDLSGVRDRLAVLSESDAGRWLDPAAGTAFDLLEAIRSRAVVLFRLDADRRPLLAAMLGAAIVQDLVTCVAALQAEPAPCLVALDEFSAISAEHVGRLFGRARSAAVALMLATQEISDLRLPGRTGLLEQVLGNVGAVVSHRQIVPASADLIASIVGTQGGWSATLRSDGAASHTRVREYVIHPEQVKALPRGWAAVLVPGHRSPVRITAISPPRA